MKMKSLFINFGSFCLTNKQSNSIKKSALTGALLFTGLTLNAQIISHPESFDGYGWGEKNNTNVILSLGKYSESYIVNYDLTNGRFTYLNDSTSERLRNFVMIGDTGVARSGTGNVYYTHNNWKDILSTSQNFLEIIKTESGLLGSKSVSSTVAEYYHSTDGNNWTLVNTSAKGPIANRDGKTWLISSPTDFNISYDGGLTYTNKTPTGAPSVYFSDFIALDSISGIGIVTSNSWYYTSDGGDTWTSFNGLFATNFIYASSLDTIYGEFTTGIEMTLDTGLTWQPVSIPMPENSPTRLYDVGNYLVGQIGWNGQFATFKSEGINMQWTQLHARVIRADYNDVSFYGDKGIIVGDDGNYAYSHNKGRTYINGSSPLGGEDLKACEVLNDTLILVGDRQSNIWVSNDAGLTWSKNYSNSFNYISRKFRASDDLNTIVLFRNGQNVLSTNKGATWNLLGSLGGSFDGTVTPSGDVLIVSGNNILEMNKSNGSTTVIQAFTEPNVQGVILEMIDDNNGYVIAKNTTDETTTIFRTTDGWVNYTNTGVINSDLTTEPNPFVPSITVQMNLGLNIISPDTLYINRYNTSDGSSSLNKIYKSFDGGASWFTDSLVPPKQGGSTDKLQGMHYFAGETFVSVWEDGRIVQNLKTVNGNGNVGLEEFSLNQSNERSVLIYPNPTTDIINLKSTENIEDLYLIDISGKLILSEQVQNKVHQINMGNLPSGIYFLKIKTDTKIETQKIVKRN